MISRDGSANKPQNVERARVSSTYARDSNLQSRIAQNNGLDPEKTDSTVHYLKEYINQMILENCAIR